MYALSLLDAEPLPELDDESESELVEPDPELVEQLELDSLVFD